MLDLQRAYIRNFPEVKAYFVQMKPDLETSVQIDDDFIYIKGKETYIPGILDKTITALEVLQSLEWTHLVRTNISTIINIPVLRQLFQTDESGRCVYASSAMPPVQGYNIACGITDPKLFPIRYASGTNIILSRMLCHLLLCNSKSLRRDIIDDVSIAELIDRMSKIHKVEYRCFEGKIIHIDKCSIKHLNDKITNQYLAYRHRQAGDNRQLDVDNMKHTIKLLTERSINS